jgi:CheY-like chemotaxis protein
LNGFGAAWGNIIVTPTPLKPEDFKILLIDDNQDSIESTADLLKYFGYSVRTAQDGEQGLKVASEFQPHLILSDIGLPGIDGYQLAPALRKMAEGRKLVLAAITGYGQDLDKARCRSAGYDHHMVKPLEADTLLNYIAQLVATYNHG